MFPFAPPLNLLTLSSGLFQSPHSEKTSKAREQIQIIHNVPDKAGANNWINTSENEKGKSAATAKVHLIMDGLRTQQQNAQELKQGLMELKEKIDSVTNKTEKGFLRYSETKGLYLSNHFKLLETVGLRDSGAAKFEKKIDGLELEFGKRTSKENIASKIDKKLADQDKYIEFLGERIKAQEEKLPAKQPSTNDADSPTRHGIESDQHDDMDHELSPWPKANPQHQFTHSLISEYLKRGQPDMTDHEIEFLESILNARESAEQEDSQSNLNTTSNTATQMDSRKLKEPTTPPQPMPERPDSNRISKNPVDQAFDNLFYSDPTLSEMPAKAIEEEFDKLFKSEEKIPDGRDGLPSSLVRRSESEVGTLSTPIRPPRKIDLLKTLNRTQSNPENPAKGMTEDKFNGLRAFWETQGKPGSV